MSRTLYKIAITAWILLLAVALLIGGFGAMLGVEFDRQQWAWLVAILGGGGVLAFLGGAMLDLWSRRDA